jgi:hypothetical protein
MKAKPQTCCPFTERDIQLMFSNPVYAGIGIYPAMVPEETWIAAAIVEVQERGSGFWLDVYTNIIESFNVPVDKAIILCRRFQSIYEAVDQDSLRQAIMKGFLHDLRLLVTKCQSSHHPA